MHTFIRFRPVALGLVALATLLALAGPAAAASDKVIRDESAGTFNNPDFCGLDVDGSFQDSFRATIHNWVIQDNGPGTDGFWIGNINDHGSATLTNTANGKSVLQTWNNNIKEASLVDIGGGYYEYTFSQNGFPVRLGGRPIDVGRIVITQTLYFGDLSTDSDDSFVSGFASFDAGRHPVFYDDAPFCDALIAAIG
jgi:hypothetical protein